MDRVAETMREQGRQTQWVAAQLGIDISYMSLLAHGKRNWTPRLRTKVAEVLGVEEGVLFFESDCLSPDNECSQTDNVAVSEQVA